jgi:hypothetical protein
MHVIDELPVADALEKRRLQVVNAVPSHLRNLVGVLLGLETLYVEGKDAQAICVTLLAMPAHQLLAYAYSQHGLAKFRYHSVQVMLAQVCHCRACLALARKQHLVGLCQQFGIVRQCGCDAQALQRMDYGIYIAGVVFYYGYVHLCWFSFSSV